MKRLLLGAVALLVLAAGVRGIIQIFVDMVICGAFLGIVFLLCYLFGKLK